MQIKSILAGTAIALALGLGSASAGDEFETLHGFQPQALSDSELASVTATSDAFLVAGGGRFGLQVRAAVQDAAFLSLVDASMLTEHLVIDIAD